MKFLVNESCIGCGICAATCPDVFEMNDASVAQAMDGNVPPAQEEEALQAQDSCPVNAIENDTSQGDGPWTKAL